YKSSLTGKYSDTLFIPYNDKSNGSGSYDAGRYLDIPEPKGAQMVLDFNFSYNPLCNYSDAYNCPIPPRENNLEVAINAGEKTYPH
ncbi:MAG: DUF1684 domain-containing protein, partial [bacterium]|nr:DUF1684 domain-containing protein [bacterium]